MACNIVMDAVKTITMTSLGMKEDNFGKILEKEMAYIKKML